MNINNSISDLNKNHISYIKGMRGLIGFWIINELRIDNYYDQEIISKPHRMYLKRIGDDNSYDLCDWKYNDENSILDFDRSGPFGNAIKLNAGYIYGEIPREEFENTRLNLSLKESSFTIIAWIKFYGKRHLICGIWNEGQLERYNGAREIALFSNGFNRNGVIAHISSTGSASFPQSNLYDALYARDRAIDWQKIPDNRWCAVALTYDISKKELTAYLNGFSVPMKLTDLVEKDVYKYRFNKNCNPLMFDWPIFSSKRFIIKFNGYDGLTDGVYEHFIKIDLIKNTVQYKRIERIRQLENYFIEIQILGGDQEILNEIYKVHNGCILNLPKEHNIREGDHIILTLYKECNDKLKKIGTSIKHKVRKGAPFTIGRAPGVYDDNINFGSQFYLDGFAVFDHVLDKEVLKKISFIDNMHKLSKTDIKNALIRSSLIPMFFKRNFL